MEKAEGRLNKKSRAQGTQAFISSAAVEFFFLFGAAMQYLLGTAKIAGA